jgi:methylmalonyl-CoA mutase
VTLYGNDPHIRPDIYGKIGNAGVSICCLDDAKKLYLVLILVHALTSVDNQWTSTYATWIMNAAIDQQCELYIKANALKRS